MGAEMGVLSPVMDCTRTKQMGKTMRLEQRQICHFTALTVGSGDNQFTDTDLDCATFNKAYNYSGLLSSRGKIRAASKG